MGKLGLKISIFVFITACSTTTTNIDREPDIISQRANWKDYYTWDGKRWVWSEYLPKKKANKQVKKKWIEEDIQGEVTFGKPKIEGRKD
jgi:hypothetical protein